MKKVISLISMLLLCVAFAGTSQAEVLDFNDPGNLGLTLGGSMYWNGTGGGHLYCEQYYDDDYIYFDSPTYVSNFMMTGIPWEGYTGGQFGLIDIGAYDESGLQIWFDTIDLTNYYTWNQWLEVTVDVADVKSMKFFSPYNTHGNGFWPSIDNMTINEGGDVTLDMEPINPPIVIPAKGGTFSFTATITNNTATSQTVQAFIDVVLPNGQVYGPVLGPVNLTLKANQIFTKTLKQKVPGAAPAGLYEYVGHIVFSTGTDDDSFTFTKQ